jgi:predicted RNase H-like HicB family nuclease
MARKSPNLALDRPFEPYLVERAKEIARRYRIVLESCDDCSYLGSALEMPTVFADGKTPDECVAETREALTAAVAYLLEKGETPPAPADEQVRNKQINIRVTEAEQQRLREAAKAHGFNDVSDYVRTTSLASREA